MGQVFQPGGGAGYFVPTINPSAARSNFFAAPQMPQMRAGPRWPNVRPAAPAGASKSCNMSLVLGSHDLMHVSSQRSLCSHQLNIQLTVKV
ncbi:hypothetical protein DPMN_183030 [Dreissena polymorpha]|uniref:Uncharacterized protein n=1 Tax=Dreissena polymorpha TaxID=45954 RepID=A0A9D4I575_DREPO|nr:hypothetical protein DPMN_183030 [Dreissena polymorpha]